MKLLKHNKQILKKEFAFVIKKIENSNTPEEMLYYFTGIYTVMHRIYNTEFSEDLLFAHSILEKAYKDIVSRLHALKSGQNVIKFHKDFSLTMLEYIKELERDFYNTPKRLEVLKKITVLAYTTSGNGFYLLQKNLITDFSDYKQISDKS